MVNSTTSQTPEDQFFTPFEMHEKKHLKVNEINYRNNTNSDYTEKIRDLDKNFNYSSHSNDYWSEPNLSLLYGTPIYEAASPAQKLALNHLYWAGQYIQTAATEANAVVYNQLTAGVFSTIDGYKKLCQELDLETDQERVHIHAFHTISYKTKLALLGKAALGNPLYKKKLDNSRFSFRLPSLQNLSIRDSTLRFITSTMLKNKAEYYSLYLKDFDKEGKSIPVPGGSVFEPSRSQSLQKFFTLNWGSSPFLACQYYVQRFMANMLLKNYEYSYTKYFRDLSDQEKPIPTPTAISFYHFMDEAFHTTTSQLIARDMYKDFPKPTTYEKFVANLGLCLSQRDVVSGLSAGVPAIFRDDTTFLLVYYRILRSPVFDMSVQDTLYWMQKCLCEEHEGFHMNVKHHQRLLTSLRNFFDELDFLCPVNRDMSIMALGGTISKSIQRNTKAFNLFSQSVTA